MLRLTSRGLYCVPGNFHIDPSRAVPRAVITHAHSDHARRGSQRYLTTVAGEQVLRARMGTRANIDTLNYGEQVVLDGVRVSLHPAGHLLGSAQVRMEYRGEVWVVTGDYKIESDSTCQRFEVVRCDCFCTESTFALPVYRWPDAQSELLEINRWWRQNREMGDSSILLGYSLGKSQRLIAGLNAEIGPIYCHPAVEEMNAAYRRAGVMMPPTHKMSAGSQETLPASAMLIVPPGSEMLRSLKLAGTPRVAVASGWMHLRKHRHRERLDRTFVLSDHADWPGLNWAIRESGAERIYAMHGEIEPLVYWLQEQGWDAHSIETLRVP